MKDTSHFVIDLYGNQIVHWIFGSVSVVPSTKSLYDRGMARGDDDNLSKEVAAHKKAACIWRGGARPIEQGWLSRAMLLQLVRMA